MSKDMNELGSLSEIITNHKADFRQLLQVEVDSTIDLHLPECIINSHSLSPMQLYDELCLHAYAHKKAVITFAKNILILHYQLREQELPEPNGIEYVLKRTYIRIARKLSKDSFWDSFRKHLEKKFYDSLPKIADHTGIKYLAEFLPLKRLPKIRKPNQDSQRRTIENQFILRASELTQYDKETGTLTPPKRGHGQYCGLKTCKNKTEFKPVYPYLAIEDDMFNPANAWGLYYYRDRKRVAIRTVEVDAKKNNKELFFVCSKNCSDALRVYLRRHPQLTN